jgi:hypothetical protein
METTNQSEVYKEIEGKHGTITILKPSREANAADKDIHSLLARILYKKMIRENTTKRGIITGKGAYGLESRR